MTYTQVTFLISPAIPWRDILMVELTELGYEGFEDSFTDPSGPSGELKAYIPEDRFSAAALSGLLTLRDPHASVSWTTENIAPRNWNAEWESSFQPVEVGKEVIIRADFHAAVPGFTHDLVVTPRMAFGTGHHATTRMMVRAMLEVDLKDKTVCDLGCGTGVLAILAEKMGAVDIAAIDYDQGAVDNALENLERNACERITAEKGDADSLKGRSFDVILANIERNTLLKAMQSMYDALNPGGILFLSGFVVADRHLMEDAAKTVGMVIEESLSEGDWALVGCRRPSA